MFEKFRIRTALKFGKMEHKFGRVIAVPIIISIIWNLKQKDYTNVGVSTVTLICWIIYLVSHTMEKRFYGNLGFRNRKG